MTQSLQICIEEKFPLFSPSKDKQQTNQALASGKFLNLCPKAKQEHQLMQEQRKINMTIIPTCAGIHTTYLKNAEDLIDLSFLPLVAEFPLQFLLHFYVSVLAP